MRIGWGRTMMFAVALTQASWSAGAGEVQASREEDRLAPLRFLVGACWRGTFPDGDSFDTHCYEDVYDGRFIRDRHAVRSEGPPYRGETIYHWDPETRTIRYRYWSSDGGVSDGGAELDGTRILFPGERHVRADGSVVEMRTVMERIEDGAYRSTTEELTTAGWKETWSIDFSRLDAWSIDDARIVYTGRRNGIANLYLHDRASGHTTRLTHVRAEDAGANAGAPSPDGARIAFQLRRGQSYDVHVMDLHAIQSTNVSRHPEYDVSPVWSPDGREIAFLSTRSFALGSIGPFPGHVYVADPGGASVRAITREPLTSALGPSDWSPDGGSLLIARVTGDRPDLFLLDVRSGNEVRLTDTPEGEYSAVFSRDGRRIASHAEGEGVSHIVVMRRDGSERRVLTEGPGLRYDPQWSPDDEWILFTASDDGAQYDLRAVHVREGTVVELVATPEDEREGRWLPSR